MRRSILLSNTELRHTAFCILRSQFPEQTCWPLRLQVELCILYCKLVLPERVVVFRARCAASPWRKAVRLDFAACGTRGMLVKCCYAERINNRLQIARNCQFLEHAQARIPFQICVSTRS